jgi:DNA-binding SARP family transcriptional activator
MWFEVLGDVGGRADRPLHLTSRRQRTLLAYLICHRGRYVSVDRLVEAV